MEKPDIKELLDDLLAVLNTVNRVNRALGQFDGEDDDIYLSMSPIQIQAVIAVRRYRRLNMSELAGLLYVTKPQLTKIVDSLVGAGLIVRKADPQNRRVVLIELSEKGERYVEERILGRGFLLQSLQCIGEEEREELRKAFQVILQTFAKIETE